MHNEALCMGMIYYHNYDNNQNMAQIMCQSNMTTLSSWYNYRQVNVYVNIKINFLISL